MVQQFVLFSAGLPAFGEHVLTELCQFFCPPSLCMWSDLSSWDFLFDCLLYDICQPCACLVELTLGLYELRDSLCR
jgi:hypothetical protein